MKLLVTGADGQVGSEFKRHPLAQQVILLNRQALDIGEPAQVNAAIQHHQPDVVVNAAAYTKVDQAEQEQELANRVNHLGALNLAKACAQFKIPLLQLSTDYVFDGEKTSAYTEGDETNPRSVYGRTKWLGELAVRDTLSTHVILRVSWVFGVYGQNFVKTILRLAQERERLTIVDDQRGCPTAAKDIAAVIFRLCEQMVSHQLPWGTYHFCGMQPVSWYQFAEAILAKATHLPLRTRELLPITTAEYPTAAKRPSNSVLNCQKITEGLQITPPHWEHELSNVIRELSA